LLDPAAKTLPSTRRNSVCHSPPSTCATPLSEATCAGVVCASEAVPMPNWPNWLWPHAYALPSEVTANEPASPTPIETTFTSPDTCCGNGCAGDWTPIPSWPYPLPPYAHTVPSVFSTTVW
jgi:hypothetical protein